MTRASVSQASPLAFIVVAASIQDRGAVASVVAQACAEVVNSALDYVPPAGFLTGCEIARRHLYGYTGAAGCAVH